MADLTNHHISRFYQKLWEIERRFLPLFSEGISVFCSCKSITILELKALCNPQGFFYCVRRLESKHFHIEDIRRDVYT